MTAGKRVAPQEAAIIRDYLENTDLTCRQIAAKVPPLCGRTVQRMRLNFELFDAPYPPSFVKKGRPRTLTSDQENYIIAFLNEHPTSNIEEVKLAIWERWDVPVSRWAIYRCLLQAKWSRKEALKAREARADQQTSSKQKQVPSVAKPTHMQSLSSETLAGT